MPDSKRRFLEFKKYEEYEWFRFLVYLLFLVAAAYITSHLLVSDSARYEYQKLDKEQLQQINQIYFDVENSADQQTSKDADSSANKTTVSKKGITNPDTSLAAKSDKTVEFIQNQFNYKVDSDQIKKVRRYLHSSLPLEAMGFLGKVRFRVQSYFWLVGPEVYFEIIFWAWFGVLASILFNLGVIGRNKTANGENEKTVFDSSEIPYQVAKLLYAPLATLAIVLGYNYFNGENIVDISSSKGVIVFAFIGGFYCARLIALLDRLKEVLLPNSGTSNVAQQTQTTSSVPMLKNISISLQFDETTVLAETIPQIKSIGFNDASVTLESTQTSEVVTAPPLAGQESKFIVSEIKPGTYTIRAKWSKPINDQPMTLEAEQIEELKENGATIIVTLKKAKESE